MKPIAMAVLEEMRMRFVLRGQEEKQIDWGVLHDSKTDGTELPLTSLSECLNGSAYHMVGHWGDVE